MATNAFEASIEGLKSVWGPISTEVVVGSRRYLEDVLNAPSTEEWLSALHREAPANKERVTRYIERNGAWTAGDA